MTCCPLSGVLSAFLPPGFLMMLQMSSTFLSMRILSWLGLSSPYSLMGNLAALALNPSQMYIFWSFKAMILGPHTVCTHTIPMYCFLGIIYWQRVLSQGISIFAYFASEYMSLCSWGLCSTMDSKPSLSVVFAYCGIWLVLLLRISCMLFCAFLLWSRCRASPQQSGHLGSEQTTLSTTDASCYCHYDN